MHVETILNVVKHSIHHLLSCVVPVTDPSVRLMVLSQLARAEIVEENIRLGAGLNEAASTTLARLSQLSLTDLTRLSNLLRAPTIEIAMNTHSHDCRHFSNAFSTLEHIPFQYYIRAGATNSLTATLIPVTDPTLRIVILSFLINKSKEENSPSKEILGASKQEILPINYLINTSTTGFEPTIEIRVDMSKLDSEVNRYQHITSDQAMLNYFIQTGSSIRMMTELFKISKSDIRHAQASLGIRTVIGRRKVPDENACLEILQTWIEIEKSTQSRRQQFYNLHQVFHKYTMAQLYGVVKA